MGAVDALGALTEGFGSFKDAAISAIKQVIAEMIRLQLMKLAVGLLGGAAGGGAPNLSSGGGVTTGGTAGGGFAGYVGIGSNLPKFATGGGFTIGGNRGTDRNVMSLNGLPIARVSHGERVNISNDNHGMGGGFTAHININGPVSNPRETGNQIAAAMRARIARANQRGY